MNGDLLFALAVSLGLTLALEVGFFVASRLALRVSPRDAGGKDLLLVVLVNVLTNPVVVLFYWLGALYTGWNRTLIKIPLEVFAVVTEGVYYRKYGRGFKRPFLFSIAANAFSFFAGVLFQMI